MIGFPALRGFGDEQPKRRSIRKKFVPIHRGTLLNIDWIKEITSLPGGGLDVRLKESNGTDLAVSRDRARDLKARIF